MITSIFNRLLISIAPKLPLSFIRKIAGRYVAGETQNSALNIIKELNNKGYSVTVDILGEHSQSKRTASLIREQYINLYVEIQSLNLDCNISIKPTHLGLDVSRDCAQNNIFTLLKFAEKCNNFLRIDMENSSVTDATIELYKKCNDIYSEVGIVLQAYLYRSYDDLKTLSKNNNFNFRLCKGIYQENSDIAFQGRDEINNNFIKILRYAFENEIYIGIATHDLKLIECAYKMIEKMNISSEKYEFQVLYGVPMAGWLEKHIQNGYRVRIYVPFGQNWYEYSMRRLKENPKIANYIFKNIFRK